VMKNTADTNLINYLIKLNSSVCFYMLLS